MLIGYNTNVPYKGTVYHVQTEDNGQTNPSITTLLYCKGAILHSVKTVYADIADKPDFEEQLRERMKHQHREMIRALIKGKFEAETPGGEDVSPKAEKLCETPENKAKEAAAHPRSLDEILLEHISRKVNK